MSLGCKYQIIKLKQQMSKNETIPLLLIYYNIRGKLQVIRHLLCYLGKAFEELHIQLIESKIQQPEPATLERLKEKPIDKTKLPLLVVGNQYIYGGISIVISLCKRFNLHRLLGNSIEEGLQVAKMMQQILFQDGKGKGNLFKFAEKNYQQPDEEIKKKLMPFYQEAISQSKYIERVCSLIQDLNNSGFIYSNITIVDFYFFETCYYFLGFFGKIDEEQQHIEWFSLDSEPEQVRDNIEKPACIKYLRTMRKYYIRFKGITHYARYRELLESFTIDFAYHSSERKIGMKKIWVENF